MHKEQSTAAVIKRVTASAREARDNLKQWAERRRGAVMLVQKLPVCDWQQSSREGNMKWQKPSMAKSDLQSNSPSE